ncbi:Nn.00g118010.m01.CDS01 [Neocucurbitaria sp. VM-36]
MRSMIARYDKTGSIRGTAAFEQFLKWEGEGAGDGEGDLTVPVDDEEPGAAYGARQAIIMGFPESAMNANGPKGLGTLERQDDNEYFALKRRY